MKNCTIVISIFIVTFSCQLETVSLSTDASETFYVDNKGVSMPVLVEGNTRSNTFLLFVHGGPGSSGCFFNTDYISQNIEDKYACVYWDERNAGASQGNNNGKNLHLSQMTDDLKKVILVLKHRYGQDAAIFILGHSFGGLLTTSFMTTADNQSMVKGWIYADGAHNYPLNDTLTRQKLMTFGEQQIASNTNVGKWTPVVNYCKSHSGPFSLKESFKLTSYAIDAETWFDDVKEYNLLSVVSKNALKNDWAVTSIMVNYLYSANAGFNSELAVTQFSSSLNKVVAPTLILWGKYDFVCPEGLGEELYNKISTDDKKIVVSPISGHEIFYQDEALFCEEINEFIKRHR
jgi:pimeloyl-ACP methyl ester carboxylesterase